MSAGELADHIVGSHHVDLRQHLPQLSKLIDKVVDAHSAKHPEVFGIRQTFAALRQELEQHMMNEEQVLFPLVKRLEAARAPFSIHCGTVENPILVMEHEHERAGSALRRMRVLAGAVRWPQKIQTPAGDAPAGGESRWDHV
jgi:regulator of cell morphogenesis and NO signaling